MDFIWFKTKEDPRPQSIAIAAARQLVGGNTDEETEALFFQGYSVYLKTDPPPADQGVPMMASDATTEALPEPGKGKGRPK